MNKIAVIPNLEKDENGIGTKEVLACLRLHGITPIMDKTLQGFGFDADFSDKYESENIDMAIIMGGDGTFLTKGSRFINTPVPVLGINHGNMGFLTELERNDIAGLTEILNGKYTIDKRPVIKAEHLEKVHMSINEIAVYLGISPKMLDIEIIIDGVSMNKFRADGLIVSTPSGSTAYSMSAGGPIVNPSVEAFIITPICPHDLYLRSIVVPTEADICIKLTNIETKIAFSIDGTLISEITGSHIIRLSKGGYLNTVRHDVKSFYNKLKKKFFEKDM